MKEIYLDAKAKIESIQRENAGDRFIGALNLDEELELVLEIERLREALRWALENRPPITISTVFDEKLTKILGE